MSQKKNFTLSDEAVRVIEGFSEKYDIPQTKVVEVALKSLFLREEEMKDLFFLSWREVVERKKEKGRNKEEAPTSEAVSKTTSEAVSKEVSKEVHHSSYKFPKI